MTRPCDRLGAFRTVQLIKAFFDISATRLPLADLVGEPAVLALLIR